MLLAKALFIWLWNKWGDPSIPQRLHLIEASPTRGQFRWQASLALHASKLTKPTLSLCYHIKLNYKCQPKSLPTCLWKYVNGNASHMLLTMTLFILSDCMGQLVITFLQYNESHVYLFFRLLWKSKRGRIPHLCVMILQSSFTHYLFNLTMIDVRYYYYRYYF